MQCENNTLYYIYDPMCSWCYAYENCLTQLQRALPSEISFQTILGGLAPDTSSPMPLATQTMIQNAWRQIESSVANVQFNFDFWIKNTPYRSTYPACRAILAAANQSPEFAAPLRKAIQQAYYQDAKNPSLNDVLITCASQLDLDINQFSKDLPSLGIDIKLTEQRHFAKHLGVSSYPSLRLVIDSEVYPIPVDYNSVAMSLELINERLNSHTKSVIESPCIRNCCLNDADVCLGCFRLLDEITNWAYCSNAEKQAVLQQAEQRKRIYNRSLI